MQSGYVFTQSNEKPGVYATFGDSDSELHPYTMMDTMGTKSAEKLKIESPIYEDVTERIMPHTTPSMLKREIDYELAKARSDAKYDSSRAKSDGIIEKLKSLMHYTPPPDVLNEIISGYDSSNEFHMDDDDVRTSSRGLYDNWPYFYHSPYEYEHNKDIFDMEKAKDKRYAADKIQSIIPVHEIIENDVPNDYERTAKYFRDVTDNPMVGDEPFFSFVLNDYFERSNEEDPLVFKGLDWGRDFDHNGFLSGMDDVIRNRRIEKTYHPTVSSKPDVLVYSTNVDSTTSQAVSATGKGHRKHSDFDKHENGAKKISNLKTEFENSENKYNGFKDFLDNFANKFGAEDHKKKIKYIHQTNKDKGENRKGFHRVYHKDEYQEDKDFYDNNNSSTRGEEKASSNAHIGGSEAYLRSQAAAAIGNVTNAANNSGITKDERFENSKKGHDKFNTLENQFNKYIDVAKQAALSNNADYIEQYRI